MGRLVGDLKNDKNPKSVKSVALNTIYKAIVTLVYCHKFFKNWMFAFKTL